MKNKYIIDLFENWANEKVISAKQLPQSGSYRKYYRIKSASKSAIAVENSDFQENFAFVEFSKNFKSKNLNVPEIFAENLDKNIYLQQDLGQTTLYDYLKSSNSIDDFKTETIDIYKNILHKLYKFQTVGHENFNYSICYPRAEFDSQSIMWDLNYFKYSFLKVAKIPFNEQNLEMDFETITEKLLTAKNDFFLFRDFQSRNIMLIDKTPYFIDYQGGRKGAVYYDLASLLFDAKAKIPNKIRLQLVDFFYNIYSKENNISKEEFLNYFFLFALIRILQAFGAYGFRGLIEKKIHFIQSIPHAIENLKFILENIDKNLNIPQLKSSLEYLIKNSEFSNSSKTADYQFNIEIKSFSFKKEVPKSNLAHGGGFVFDCRFLPNPGRYEEYKSSSGLDNNVKEFLNSETEVEKFISETYQIIENVIKKYINRKFDSLSIYFGCTGGQHRSVFCAEELASIIKDEFNISPNIEHIEKENWGKR